MYKQEKEIRNSKWNKIKLITPRQIHANAHTVIGSNASSVPSFLHSQKELKIPHNLYMFQERGNLYRQSNLYCEDKGFLLFLFFFGGLICRLNVEPLYLVFFESIFQNSLLLRLLLHYPNKNGESPQTKIEIRSRKAESIGFWGKLEKESQMRESVCEERVENFGVTVENYRELTIVN